MKTVLKFLFATIATTFTVYTFAQKESVVVIDLNRALSTPPKEIMLGEIASDIRYIPLETTDDCLIANAYDVRYSGNDILVGSEGYFFHFDGDGKFLNRIGSKGNGPGEYNFGMFYFLDPVRRYIYIYELNYMLCYTYDNRFVRKLQAPNLNMGTAELYAGDRILYSNDMYFSTPNNPIQVFTMDTLGKSVGKISGHVEKNRRYGLNLSTRDFMYNYNGMTFFKPALENVVYRVTTPKKMEPAIRFETGSKDIDVSRNEIRAGDRMKSISVFQIRETDKYIFVLYGYENRTYSGLYDRIAGTFDNVTIRDNLSGGMDIVPAGKCDDRYICMVYPPATIREAKRYTHASLPERKEAFDRLLTESDDDDNPVLILMMLR
jgi:hypothetical protein